MITFEEALKKANEIKSGIDCGTEFENGYIFDKKDEQNGEIRYGGLLPIHMFKKNGEVVPSITFMLGNSGEPVKNFELQKDGTWKDTPYVEND